MASGASTDVAAELALDVMRARAGSALERRALGRLALENELGEQARSGEAPVDAAADLGNVAAAASRGLADYAARRRARLQVADYLERIILPRTPDTQLHRLPERLRRARARAWVQYCPSENARLRYIWDHKASEPLLCPDDAREEAQRLSRRLEDKIEQLGRQGLRCYFAVLTMPNAARGDLQGGIDRLWKRFRETIKAPVERAPGDMRPRKALPKRFPIAGAVAVLEAPLGRFRDWHPHLNVILLTRGRLDWGDWRAAWSYVCDFTVLKPGNVAAAMRELIKYAVRAVPEKSAAKASQASQDGAGAAAAKNAGGDLFPDEKLTAPAMIEWSAPEWLEWWAAMKGHRRTRTYGELYGIGEDAPEPDRQWVSVGRADWIGTQFRLWFPSLAFIPGDKSDRLSHRSDARQAWLEHGPPDPGPGG